MVGGSLFRVLLHSDLGSSWDLTYPSIRIVSFLKLVHWWMVYSLNSWFEILCANVLHHRLSHTHARTHAHTHTYIYTYIHTHTHACTYIHTYTRGRTHTYTHCTRTCTHTHTDTHIIASFISHVANFFNDVWQIVSRLHLSLRTMLVVCLYQHHALCDWKLALKCRWLVIKPLIWEVFILNVCLYSV